MTDDGWVSDDDLEAARQMEQTVFGGSASPYSKGSKGTKAVALRLFEENAAMAAMELIRLARNGSNEQIRFKAAESILNRALGRPVDANASTNANSVGELNDLVAELSANQQGPSTQS